jgi:hypothetical protein
MAVTTQKIQILYFFQIALFAALPDRSDAECGGASDVTSYA